jgi:signal peptidase I
MERLRDILGRVPADVRRVGRGVFDFIKTLVIAFLLAQIVMVSVAQAFQVEQYSMEPTLLPHDRVLVNKFVYRFRQPQREDIIVLRYPRDPGRNYIKRIVALPGDVVDIRDGRLLINKAPVDEVYLNGAPTGDYGPETVPADSLFVLGDNRNNSEDSRTFGFLKRDLVVGQAMLIYWPPSRVRLLRAR